MDNSIFKSEAFLGLDSTTQSKVALEHFKESFTTTKTYKSLNQDQRNTVYNNYLGEVMPQKGVIERVVDSIAAPFKAVAAAYEKDQEPKQTKPITATETLALAQPMYEMGRRSEAYMKNLKHAAELEQGQIKREEQKKKRTAQIEQSKKPVLQQLSDQFNPARPIVAIPSIVGSLVGGEETGKAIAKEFGGDYQYSTGKRDTTFSEANPDYLMAESVIMDPLNAIGAPIKAVGRAVNIAKIRQAKLANNPLHSAAQDIIDSSAQHLGLELPKAQAPEVIAKDEAVAKAMNQEYVSPQAIEPQVTQVVENPHPDGTRPADFVDDINVGRKVEEPVIDTKAQAKAQQEERVAKANEEAMIRKAEFDAKAKEEVDALYKSDVESISNNPRFQELIDMRREVSAKQSEKPNIRDSNRQIIHENNGTGYETTIIPAMDSKNYNHDFALTKSDIKAYEKNGMTPDLVEKFKKDLDVLDNDPMWRKVDENPPADLGHVEGDKYINENGIEEEIPFSKGIQPIEAHNIETMGQSLNSSLGEPLVQKLSPIMATINKADIPEAVLAKAKGNPEGIHGFVYEGKAYIVADNIPKEWSTQQVRGLVMHEVGVHLRKVGVEDKEFGKVLNLLKDSKDPLIKDAYARVPKDTEIHLIDEEALAYLIQNHPDTTIARRAITWVKQQLIRMGISPSTLKLTPADLSAMAWGAVKRGDGSVKSTDTMLMAPFGKDAKISELTGIPQELEKFGKNYTKYKSNPKGAINHLIKVQRGQVRGALYHPEIGEIDIAWGKVTNPIEHEGYGLSHIIDKHGEEVARQLDDIVMGGKVTRQKGNSVEIVNNEYMAVIKLDWYGKEKQWVVTTFDMPPHQSITDDVVSGGKSGNLSPQAHDEIIPPSNVESQVPQFSRAESPQESAGGFYSAAQKAIDKMPNKMETDAFIKYLKNNGVKDDEITWSGITKAIEGKETITKDEIMGVFGNPVMESKVLSGVPSDEEILKSKEWFGIEDNVWEKITQAEKQSYYDEMMQNRKNKVPNQAKYEGYSIKDVGENYREELMTLPSENKLKLAELNKQYDELDNKIKITEYGSDEYNLLKAQRSAINDEIQAIPYNSNGLYKSSHWDEPNVLLHTRKQDTLIDGQKTLLVEEIQSDWHQDGRKIGYEIDPMKRHEELNQQLANKEISYEEFTRELKKINSNKKLPQAPYSKTWHEFGMRQVIDEAVMNGYERVAWVKGATQAERYSLSQSLDRLVYNKDANIIQGFKDGEEVMYKNATENELESLIGKDPAKKLMESEVKTNIYEIKGEQLDIGGDGMKGFYDKILVDFTRKYTKKWGVEVETKMLPDGTEVHSFPVNAKMKEDVAKNGQALYAHGAGVMAGVGEDENGNMTFDPLMALAGIAGVSVVMSKTVRSSLSKLAGKTEHLSDSVIQGMVRVAIKSADKVTIGKVSGFLKGIMDSQTMDDAIGHRIYKLKDYMKLREDTLRSVNGSMEFAARLHLQLAELSSEAREGLYAYMTGEKGAAISTELKGLATEFINRIDTMGKEMVDNGFLTKEAYEEWKGQYLHRKYASKIKGVNDFKSGSGEFSVDSIKMRGKQWDVTQEEYDALLKNGDIGKVSEGKIEVLHESDGTYKLRRDWTKEERTAMGEIRDVAYSLPETYGRMAQMIEFGKMLKNVPSKYLLDPIEAAKMSEKMIDSLGYTKITGTKYGALNGRWVNKSIAEDIRGVHNDTFGIDGGTAGKAYRGYVAAIKKSHTIYNPTAHVNNTISNIVLQTGAGLNPIKAMNYAKDGAVANTKHSKWKVLDGKRVSGLDTAEAEELSKLEADEDFKLWRELEDRGMFGRSNLNEMLTNYMSPAVKEESQYKVIRGAKKAFIDTPEKLYQAEDDIMRFAAAKQLIKDGLWDTVEEGGKKVFKERMMSIDEAMDYVNTSIVPDYTKPMSMYARNLRDWGIMPFMSWTYHSTPVLLNQLRNHPTRFLAIMGAWYVTDFSFGINPIGWMSDDMPEKQGSSSMVINRDGNEITTARVSSMIPHAQIVPWSVFDTYVEPVLSFGILGGISGAYQNYNPYFEDKITHKKGAEGTYHRTVSAVQNILPTPDVLDKVFNIVESRVLTKDQRKRNEVFLPRTPTQEAASFFVNTRTYNLDAQHKKAQGGEKSIDKSDSKWRKKLEKVFQ